MIEYSSDEISVNCDTFTILLILLLATYYKLDTSENVLT